MSKPFLLLLLCFIPWSVIQAAESVGTVLSVAGSVYAQNSTGEKRSLTRRSPVFEKDLIITTAGGQAQLRFVDGEVLALHPDTELRIDNYVYTADKSKDASALTLLKGGLRTLSGKLADRSPQHYKVVTDLATMGVRGTYAGLAFEVVNPQTNQHILHATVFTDTRPGSKNTGIFLENNGGKIELGSDQPFNNAVVTAPNVAPVGQLNRSPIFEKNVAKAPQAPKTEQAKADSNTETEPAAVATNTTPTVEETGVAATTPSESGALSGGTGLSGVQSLAVNPLPLVDPNSQIIPPSPPPGNGRLTTTEAAAMQFEGFFVIEDGRGGASPLLGTSSLSGGLSTDGSHGSPIFIGSPSAGDPAYVMRQGNAPLDNVTVITDLGANFPISYGGWDANDTNPALLYNNQGDPTVATSVVTKVDWITARPTALVDMPISGTASYSADSTSAVNQPLFAVGGVSGTSGGDISKFAMGFNVNFATGSISNGTMTVAMNSQSSGAISGVTTTVWMGGFGAGSIQGNKFYIPTISGTVSTNNQATDTFTGDSNGIFSGPNANAVVGDFHFKNTNSGTDVIGAYGMKKQ